MREGGHVDGWRELYRAIFGADPDEPGVWSDAVVAALAVGVHRGRERRGDRDIDMILLRFGVTDGCWHTLRAVGERFGVSSARVWQIETEVLRSLRRPACAGPVSDLVRAVRKDRERY